MSTQGPNGGTGAGAGWTTPTNIATTNAVYATQSIASLGNSTTLSTSTMGFAIPVGAIINGIQVAIVGHASAISSIDLADANALGTIGVSMTKTAGTPVGTAKTDATKWVLTDGTFNFGTVSDLWGTTWSVAEVNATGFGVVIQLENINGASSRVASVDSILVTVTFTPAAAVVTSQMLKMF